jgi:hypothetical protein
MPEREAADAGAMRQTIASLLIASAILAASGTAQAYSANKVWYEVRPSGVIRVNVGYTIPELKEYRESYVEFRKKKEAEAFYWDLVRGADFYPQDPAARRFNAPPSKPDPW